MKKNLTFVRILITVLVTLVMYYFTLPAINLSDPGFYAFVIFVGAVYLFTAIVNLMDIRNIPRKLFGFPKRVLFVGGFISLVFILIILTNFVCSPLFNPKSYASRITIDETKTFTDNVSLVNFKALPLLDKDSSRKLGDRVMGQMPELVSQFVVSDLYTQINFNNNIVRVTPLEYADWIKYFTNHKEGVKGYISVNSVTGEATLTKLDKGMKYMPSAIFGEDLTRKLRFTYPTLIFGDYSFEVDNEGNPYWIVPIVKYTGVGLKEDISGVIIFDPITGESSKYDVSEIPTWVDQVYRADLIIEQVDDWGQYQNGFFNSIFGQKGVVQTTEGYNYTVMNDDVYLYTGITSASSDESNLGFILTNLRTKETFFYAVPGAEEYSAMASAEGQVQQMNYVASFPLLINLNDRPTYLISLKDNAGLVKMYAFVDVQDYQKVVVSDSSLGIEKAAENYLNNTEYTGDDSNKIEKNITIKSINEVIIEGNTYYYLIDTNSQKYKVSIKVNSDKLPFLNINDKVTIKYSSEKDVIEITEIN